MDKIYIVTHGSCEDGVIRAFKDHEKAEIYANLYDSPIKEYKFYDDFVGTEHKYYVTSLISSFSKTQRLSKSIPQTSLKYVLPNQRSTFISLYNYAPDYYSLHVMSVICEEDVSCEEDAQELAVKNADGIISIFQNMLTNNTTTFVDLLNEVDYLNNLFAGCLKSNNDT